MESASAPHLEFAFRKRNRTIEEAAMPSMNARNVFDALSTVAILATCGFLIWIGMQGNQPAAAPPVALPTEPVEVAGAPIRGNATAPLVMIEFSDYQCPFCGKFERETLQELNKRYVDTGKMQFAFKHNPIESLHPRAMSSAKAAVCAQAQGRFWPMHAALFAQPSALGDADLAAKAEAVGIDMVVFTACLETSDFRVRQDADQASRLGLKGTPAFLIGRRQNDGRVRVLSALRGALPISEFDRAIKNAEFPESSQRTWVIGSGTMFIVAIVSAAVLRRRGKRQPVSPQVS